MIASESFPFVFRRKPATLTVMRNNGYCWGRIDAPHQSKPLDVITARDWYEFPDEEAAQAFIRKAEREPASLGVAMSSNRA